MYYAKAIKHAVTKDPRKIVRTFHWRKLAKAPDSWHKLAKSVPSPKTLANVFLHSMQRPKAKTQAAKMSRKELAKEPIRTDSR